MFNTTRAFVIENEINWKVRRIKETVYSHVNQSINKRDELYKGPIPILYSATLIIKRNLEQKKETNFEHIIWEEWDNDSERTKRKIWKENNLVQCHRLVRLHYQNRNFHIENGITWLSLFSSSLSNVRYKTKQVLYYHENQILWTKLFSFVIKLFNHLEKYVVFYCTFCFFSITEPYVIISFFWKIWKYRLIFMIITYIWDSNGQKIFH